MKINSEKQLIDLISDRIAGLLKPREKKKDFAARCKVPQTTMSGYLNANRLPKIDHLINIAESCQVTLDWLITGHDRFSSVEFIQPAEDASMMAAESSNSYMPVLKPDNAFIERLKEINSEIGGNETLAQVSGISEKTLSSFNKGLEPTRPQLIALAKASNRALSWLATGESPISSGDHPAAIALRPRKDSFDEAMDEFFELVKAWQADKNGRNMRTAIEFLQDFPLRYPEMSDWLKNRRRDAGAE